MAKVKTTKTEIVQNAEPVLSESVIDSEGCIISKLEYAVSVVVNGVQVMIPPRGKLKGVKRSDFSSLRKGLYFKNKKN